MRAPGRPAGARGLTGERQARFAVAWPSPPLVRRVERAFGFLGQRPNANTDDAVKGLVKAGDGVIAPNDDGPVKDAALIAAAQEVEHYEIAAYGTLRTWAGILENAEAVRLLESTLMEEKRADQRLTQIASSLNARAAAAAH